MAAPPVAEAELRTVVGQVRRLLVEAVAICREIGSQRELAVALGRLGHVEQDTGRVAAALAAFQEAASVARGSGDGRLLAHAVRHVGDLHRHAGRLAEAEACYDEALSVYGRLEAATTAPLDYANALRPMAILKEELGQVDEARVLWRRARDLYGAAGIEAGVAECADHLVRLG